MYFQLDDIPMFRGAYTIINTSHQIKPNSMTTKFKGVRIRKVRTKMIDKETLYLSLIGNINELTRNENATLSGYEKSGNLVKANSVRLDNANKIPNLDKIFDLNFVNPLAGKIMITSLIGPRASFGGRFHPGVDMRAKTPLPVYSIGKGVITRIRNHKGGGGLYIEIRYGDNWYARYMHLSNIPDKFFGETIDGKKLSLNDFANGEYLNLYPPKINDELIKVESGWIIGTTGGASTDKYAGSSKTPHLHFDFREGIPFGEGGDYKNPLLILAKTLNNDMLGFSPQLLESNKS